MGQVGERLRERRFRYRLSKRTSPFSNSSRERGGSRP
jgi:hypothetical protein